jgi:hypothetical protein
MRSDEILAYMSRIALMKITTGSVTVTTPRGPVVLSKPGMSYVIASNQEEVKALLASNSNIKSLLREKLVSLVF